MARLQFANNAYYHVFNRGVEKRDVFLDDEDLERFIQSVSDFNTKETIGSIYEYSFLKLRGLLPEKKPIISIIAYCFNPNHYHFLLRQEVDGGISKFMQKMGIGYTNYFNEKYKRSGVLFQGKFKAKHIDSNEYLLHVSVYINLNNQISLGNPIPKLSASSWGEYCGNEKSEKSPIPCDTGIVSDQFKDSLAYKKFAEGVLPSIRERKKMEKAFGKDDWALLGNRIPK